MPADGITGPKRTSTSDRQSVEERLGHGSSRDSGLLMNDTVLVGMRDLDELLHDGVLVERNRQRLPLGRIHFYEREALAPAPAPASAVGLGISQVRHVTADRLLDVVRRDTAGCLTARNGCQHALH